jgi:hemerythrin-like domain-containing protein
MATLTDCMSIHHRYCDDLYASAEEAALAGRWDACRAATGGFAAAVAAHFGAEESTLFPRCQAANPVAQGPVSVMLGEHQLMRELLAELERAAADRDADAWLASGDTLVILMQQHNLKEERILYPLCDQAIPAAAELAEQLHTTLEGTAHV